jgi:hypothetical protein
MLADRASLPSVVDLTSIIVAMVEFEMFFIVDSYSVNLKEKMGVRKSVSIDNYARVVCRNDAHTSDEVDRYCIP